MNLEQGAESQQRKWIVCGMLLLALVLNYMDRQTLSLTIKTIQTEFHLNNTQYGQLEMGFGIAFAIGGLVFGLLADRMSVRWLYPFVLLGWSAAGLATGFADRLGSLMTPLLAPLLGTTEMSMSPDSESSKAYVGFMCCRVILGFFESGQWPCALVTTQRMLSQTDRPLGNSILQSGASIGAIMTPIIVWLFNNGQVGWWRWPYVVIGCLGLLWVFPWQATVSGMDLSLPRGATHISESATNQSAEGWRGFFTAGTVRRLTALVVVVIVINMTWQFFRAWLPKILQEQYGYSEATVPWIIAAYFIATDIGCISAGAAVKHLANRGWDVHQARVVTFAGCAMLTSLGSVAAFVAKGPLLLFLFLVVGFGALGLFPIYYSFGQEISKRHQGKVTGTLGFITWIVTSEAQVLVGKHIDAYKTYTAVMVVMGLVPLLGVIAMALLWRTNTRSAPVIATR